MYQSAEPNKHTPFFESRPSWWNRNSKYVLGGVIVILVACLGVMTFQNSSTASTSRFSNLKFNPFDKAVGKIADFGSLVLPEESMREGCRSVGLYNKEKDGGPLKPEPANSIAGAAGSGMAQFGNQVFSKSEMIKGCENAGFYDPHLD